MLDFKKILNKKILFYPFFLLLVVILAKYTTSALYAMTHYDYSQEGNYIETEDTSDKLSPLEVINGINQLESNYNDYFLENFQEISKKYPKNTKKQDEFFIQYLKNIEKYLNSPIDSSDTDESLEGMNMSIILDKYEKQIDKYGEITFYDGGIGFQMKFVKEKESYTGFLYNELKSAKIIDPNCPVLKIVHIGEGELDVDIDYTYLAENKKMLGSSIQEYLNLKKQEEKVLKNDALFLGAGEVSAPASALKDWLIMWRNFLDKNPKFYLKDKIEQDIHLYAYYLATYDCEYFDVDTIPEDTKKAYEDFLKNANPKTEEYAFIKTCYEILKMNNFKRKENDLFEKETNMYRDKYDIGALF